MEKPHVNFTLVQMRDYIRKMKLNVKPITLNLTRAETIATLKKLGHWDDSVEKKKRQRLSKKKREDIMFKEAEKLYKKVTIKKDEAVKKAFDKYVKLHLKYIDKFNDMGIKKFDTFEKVKQESDKLLKEINELIEKIDTGQVVELGLINKDVKDAQKKVKQLSKNVKSRYEMIK